MGHISLRRADNGECIACVKVRATAWNRNNAERRKKIANEYSRRSYAANPQKFCALSRAFYKHRKETDPLYLLQEVRRRALRNGIEFSLSRESIQIPDVCPVLGIPMKCGKGEPHDGSPSFDRLDPKKGYTPDNVRIISWRANRLKSNGTLEEFRRIVQFMESRE